MNNSTEENNPEVFPGNKTGGIHCRKSLISPKKQTNKQTNKQENFHRSKQEAEGFVSNCKQKKALNKDHAKKGLDRGPKLWKHADGNLMHIEYYLVLFLLTTC